MTSGSALFNIYGILFLITFIFFFYRDDMMAARANDVVIESVFLVVVGLLLHLLCVSN